MLRPTKTRPWRWQRKGVTMKNTQTHQGSAETPQSAPSEPERTREYLNNFLQGYCSKGSETCDFLMAGTDWAALASAELTHRRATFIKALDTFALEQIAAQTVDLAQVVAEVTQDLRAARKQGGTP